MPKLLFAGDFCGCNRIYDALVNKNYDILFNNIRTINDNVDYSVVNLESPIKLNDQLYEPITKCGPNIFSPQNAVEGLKYAGFNMCTLANNHIYDFGDKGLHDTLEILDKNGVDYVGAGSNLSEAKQIKYKTIQGSVIAFIACCEYEFSIANDNHYGAAPIDVGSLYYLIKEAKSNSDFVVILTHGGVEHYSFPPPEMQKRYRLLIDFGADAIVNTHQHCISGYESYNNGVIVYGLGNFCFDNNQKKETGWNIGLLCVINTEKRRNNLEIIPIKQNACDPGIFVIEGEEKEIVIDNIESINKVILDYCALCKEYEVLLSRTMREYSIVFNPFKSTFVNKLYEKGILPNLYSKLKLLFIQDMLTCDSHRDRLLHCIKHLIREK